MAGLHRTYPGPSHSREERRTMPRSPRQPGRPKHDASYKSLFAGPRTVADTLRHVLRELATRLDFSTLERLPASFVTEHLGQRHADMLWRIRIVYNGDRRWNAATDVRHLFPRAPERLVGYVPRHRYLLIELQTLDASVLPSGNTLSMIASFEQARSRERLDELVVSLTNWLTRVDEPRLLESFNAWVTLVLKGKIDEAEGTVEPIGRQEEQAEMTLIDRVRKWREEDVERGRIEGERELVRRLVSRRFGPATADRLVPVLDPLSDPERIAAVADAVLECEAAEEFIVRAREVAGTP